MKNSAFHQNVVVVTGASSGIGRELAFQLAEQGAWLALAARNVENLESVSQGCRERGGKAIPIPTDVSDPQQCQNLIQATAAEYGRIDTLINNAGVGQYARFIKLKDLVGFEQVMRVNFWGSLYCTHSALPNLIQSAGRLVCVSSQRGKLPSATADGYVASKYALVGFFDSLRNELRESGVSVTIIYPGWVSTGISSRALKPDGTQLGKIVKYELGAMPVETCARRMLKAIAKRKREDVMTLEGKLGIWLRPFFPGIVDLRLRRRT